MATIKRYNQTAAAELFTGSDLVSSKSVFILDPTNAEDEAIFFTDQEISVAEIQAVLVGSATPSVTWTVRYASDRSAAGTEMLVGGTTTTSVTTGSSVTELDNATVPADNWVWLETTAQSGTVTELAVTVKFGTPAPAPPVDPGGDFALIAWETIPALDGDDLNYYVADDGNNSNDGLTDSTPKLTLAAGYALLRTGHGDRLLLKRGDTWTNQSLGSWTKSGASTSRRMMVGTYGSGARPIIDSNTSSAISLSASANMAQHLHFIGLELTSTTYTGSGDGTRGVTIPYNLSYTGASDIILEDLYLHNHADSMVIEGTTPCRHSDIVVRGCVIADAYDYGAFANGIYCNAIDGLTIEWCGFDRAGWIDDASQAAGGVVIGHSLYVQPGCTDVLVRNNIACNADGLQARCGGTVSGNVVSRTRGAFSLGAGVTPTPGGVDIAFHDNVVVEAIAMHDSFGLAVSASNITSGSMRDNIFCGANTTDARAFWFYDEANTGVAIQNLVIADNIVHDWGGASILIQSDAGDYTNNQISGNVFQNPTNTNKWATTGVAIETSFQMTAARFSSSDNVFAPASGVDFSLHFERRGGSDHSFASWVSGITDSGSGNTAVTYTDTALTLGSYNGSIGGTATHAAFVTAMRAQEKATWDDDVTAPAIVLYFREGFTPV